MNKSNIVLATLCAVLIVLLILTFRMYQSSLANADRLQDKIDGLTEQVRQASVVRHISKQMEDIAYQQKDISDKRSDEAIQQSKIANDMRSRADMMRGRAEIERQNAEISEQNAVKSFNEAKQQRAFAEEKQVQAELAKRVADTLSYKALARSLGSLSTTQYQIGNHELAALLSYASWTYAQRYKGDVFLPAIFNALSKSSESVSSRNENKGAITKILFAGSHSFITTTKYGEIIQWNEHDGKYDATVLLRDVKCDFRDVYIDNGGVIYALSRYGQLYVKKGQQFAVSQLDGHGFLKIIPVNSSSLMFVADNALYLYSKDGLKLIKSIPLQETVSAIGEKDGNNLLFCRDGSAYEISDEGKLKILPVILNSTVTSYAWSPYLRMSALGTSSGKIYLLDNNWREEKTLIGHRSAITQVGFKESNLFSSSYDCTVDMWNLRMEKIEPVTLKSFSSWVHCFNISQDGVIWTGDESGTLSRIVISPYDMANTIHNNLKRDFTQDEWNYYIGSTIPFESFKQY